MFTRTLRRSMQRQEGQALVLACLTVLILSIAVITTVNLGHTVHEKIRLQNTADAAAYSMAAMEARAFNFYAFANRAQASHYVNAMIWHSAISFWFWVEAFLNDMFGALKTLYPCASPDPPVWTVLCIALQAIPYVGALFSILNRVMQTIRRVLAGIDRLFKSVNERIDQAIGEWVIPAHKYLQALMAGASQAMMFSTASHLIDSSLDVIQANDGNLDTSILGQAGVGVLNSCIFNRAHMAEANGNLINPRNPLTPLDPAQNREDSKIARAKKAMGGIANATRYACEGRGSVGGLFGCRPLFVTSRTISDTFNLPDWLSPVRMILDDGVLWKWGQTRLLGHRNANGISENKIHTNAVTPNVASGPIATADNMGADDLYTLAFPPVPGEYGFEKFDVLGVEVKNPFNCAKDEDPMKCHGDPRYDAGPSNNKQFGRMFKTSVWAMNDQERVSGSRRYFRDGGIHYRLLYGQPHQGAACRNRNCGFIGARDWSRWGMPYPDGNDLGLNKYKHELVSVFGVLELEIDLWAANVRGVQDAHHPWFGTMPFTHFEPGQFASACPSTTNASTAQAADRAREFNQPTTFVVLNKTAAEMRNAVDDGNGATRNEPALNWGSGVIGFSMGGGSATQLHLENDQKQFGLGPLSTKGLNVISRGQTYYHRPGNWSEQPNFFNPYWRPRLAAVWQGRYQIPLVDQASRALPAQVANFPQKIITH